MGDRHGCKKDSLNIVIEQVCLEGVEDFMLDTLYYDGKTHLWVNWVDFFLFVYWLSLKGNSVKVAVTCITVYTQMAAASLHSP